MDCTKPWIYILMGCLLLGAANARSEAASPPDHNRRMYTIQVGSHREIAPADREMERFKSLDLQVFKRHEAVIGKGMWYRIYVGLFATRALAVNFADDLKRRKIVSSYWVKTIAPPFPESIAGPKAEEKPTKPVVEEPATPPQAPSPPARMQAPKEAPSDLRPAPAPKPQEVPPEQVPSRSVTVEPTPPQTDDGREVPPTKSIKNKKNFSIGLKFGAIFANNNDRLVISSSGSGDRAYTFSGTYTPAGLVLSYQFLDRFFIRGSLEKALAANIDYYQTSLDAGVCFKQMGPITPYASVGLVYGLLDWSEFIGDFENGLGWKIGFGGYYPMGNFQIGAEAAYQAVKYKFNLPAGSSVANGVDSVDLSGFSISAGVQYRF